jgi:hypothetical protein
MLQAKLKRRQPVMKQRATNKIHDRSKMMACQCLLRVIYKPSIIVKQAQERLPNSDSIAAIHVFLSFFGSDLMRTV